MNILVVSDIHLGSPLCRTDALLELLHEDWCEIIVNGDLLDSSKFSRYHKKHWKVLSRLRKLSKKIPVHLVVGNHDKEAHILTDILGLDYCENMELVCGNHKFLFVHGDCFDSFISKYPIVTEIAANIYYFIQRIPGFKKICPMLKASSKAWLNAASMVAKKALLHVRHTDYTDIVCGHVHLATEIYDSVHSKKYWNTGTFCDEPSHYMAINKDSGIASLKMI